MPPVSILVKPASGLCNMRCRYCFYADETRLRSQASYGVMSRETLSRVLEKAAGAASNSLTVAFQGGEPTLAGLDFFEDCVRMGKSFQRPGLRISYTLQTNGLLLDGRWCDFLARNHFLVGLSLDGAKATHDSLRPDREGRGTWLRVTEAARRLEEAGVPFNVLTVVNRRTAPKIRRIYEFYRQRGFRWQQYIACLDPLEDDSAGRDAPDGDSAAYALTPEAYGRFLVELFDLWEADLERGCQPYIRQFENLIAILTGMEPESCEQRGVCSLQYVVEADGSVYPCDFFALDEYRLGNLCTDSLEEIAGRYRAADFYARFQSRPASCHSCRYFAVCRGGCLRHLTAAGENRFCGAYRMFFDARLERLARIARMVAG